MDTVVIGGGIGGLATAAFLQQRGIQAHVYEQAPALQPVGAGIVLAPNAVRLLRQLGVVEALQDRAVRARIGWEFHRWEDGRILLAQDMTQCEQLYGEAAWLVHRADLVDVLLKAVDPSTIHLDHRCVGHEQSAHKVSVRFANAATTESDLLVAADGIHSSIRHSLVGQVPARDSGLCAWRAMIPSDRLPERYASPTQTLWLGPGRHLVHYPVSAGRTVNVVAFTPAAPGKTVESWTAAGKPEDFRAEFAGWAPMVGELLNEVTQVGRWAVLDRSPVSQYVYGRVALLGDAAHPMLPFFAQGAGQAIEDAAALAETVDAACSPTQGLVAYERARVPRTARVQEASHGRATVNHLPDGPEQEARDQAFADQDPLKHSDWLYSYDAQAEAREAVRSL
ncbi:FAD-dependent monooxygenase [Streptomyces shenzhenensis]|uniref:FAD-dependent monooxygenase n=1 Tax=Streptomyces shenzhenensis TaxID=943815 RepID=UPI0015F00A9C|nr:FAD-dependent monooxygenase [Streptomyces shenzhenensis]